ncbi:biotin--[acetyl-CoA-carboxylase] ligase [Ornithinimicrobium sufpigmenti]|uniref:biotin--[acetyl-CoA-carboxylase] ligase n=1 Tax=Ornithinimicrobium sufpigmenti TaxID=2508882 RepID=UPI0010369C8C|nr:MULTISPECIES: biotin--[acetyl-CoA-carboxylase] ligase [unclassified Ornithinimicrobium]
MSTSKWAPVPSGPPWGWEQPEAHATVGSTNSEALLDPRPGRVVVADHQSAGQGRRGRTWSSPPGTGMAISAVVPPLPASVVGWVPLAAGLAVRAALRTSRWRLDVTLKWPNDVLVETGARPGKLAGILAQVADGGTIVVGTGLNVDHDVDQLPVPTATSWRLCRGGAPLPDGAREAFLHAYLSHLAHLHDELTAGRVDGVREAYRQACGTLGRPVVVHGAAGTGMTGTAVDVAADGALVLQGPGGRSEHHAGDVEHLRPGPHPG